MRPELQSYPQPGVKPAPALLEVRRLNAWYGATQVLHRIDFSLPSGGITALLGANGAGKTSTLRALCQTLRSAGDMVFDGQQLQGRATEDIVRLGVAHVPDGRGTFAALSVEENLRLGGYVRRNKAELALDIEKAYARFQILKQRYRQQAGTLSGGQQQMLAISRALMLRPKLLLLDEPSFGLAPMVVLDIFAILRRISVEEQISMLLVEQNAGLALDLAAHAYLLESGRIVLSGPVDDLKADESVRRAYLGY